MVKVSVIIPVYNVEAYIDECLNRIINQTYQVHEIIVVDDGSTDNSPQIIRKWANQFEQIKIIRLEKNSGAPGGPRNIGLTEASGDFIHFMDPDDYIDHNYYENSIPYMEQKQIDIIITNILKFNTKRKWQPYTFKHLHLFESNRMTNLYDEPNLIHNLGPANKLFRREFLLKNHLRFLEGVAYEDVYFTTCCFYLANQIYVNSETTYYWRRREDANNFSITQQKFLFQSVLDRLTIHTGIDRFLEKKGLNPYRYIKDIRAIVDFIRHANELYSFKEEERESFFTMVNAYLNHIDERALSYLPNREYNRTRFFLLRNQLDFELVATSSLKYGTLPYINVIQDDKVVPYFDFSYLKGKYPNDELLSEKLHVPQKLLVGKSSLLDGKIDAESLILSGLGYISYVKPEAGEHAVKVTVTLTNRKTKIEQVQEAIIDRIEGNQLYFSTHISGQSLSAIQNKKDIIDIYVNINVLGLEKKVRLSANKDRKAITIQNDSPNHEIYITNKGNLSIKPVKPKPEPIPEATQPAHPHSIWNFLKNLHIGVRHPKKTH